jgi:hypothetical protein
VMTVTGQDWKGRERERREGKEEGKEEEGD